MSSDKNKKAVTGWRIIAMSGTTADGREIRPEHIQQMADSYNPETYAARINLEHLRFVFPYPEVSGFGDVVALKAEKQKSGKIALLAQLAVNDNLQALWDADQKIYSSIEYRENFAGTGKAYLEGLAVTDSPASLNTSRHFSVTNTAAIAAAQSVNISEYTEMTTAAENQTKSPGLFSALLAKFAVAEPKDEPEAKTATNESQPAADPAEKYAKEIEQVKTDLAESAQFSAGLLQKVEKLEAELEKFRAELAAAETGERAPHVGAPDEAGLSW